jgi:anaerobic magnesium-protoporphyrin IX monomethyl ester cyclase
MRVALVTPGWKAENPYPPRGLAYIGAELEKEGHTVRIFDLTLKSEMPFEKMMKNIVEFFPDIVGLSAMSHNYANALEVAGFLKSKTGASIVFGGPHPTIMPEEVLRKEFIDFVVIGEGEETFLKICQNFQSKKFYGIDGLCYKDNGKTVIQPKKYFIDDLDTLPFPARHLLELDSYTLEDDHGNRMATLISSRGCPYGCTYCYKGLFGRTYRQRSPRNIVEEIKYCKDKFNYSSFYFVDDLFTLNPKRVELLAEAIKEEDLNIRWQCLARVNNATLQMFKQMKASGCYKVHFGIESGNQGVLNKVKKGITLDQVRGAVKYCKSAGIKTKGYFMIGMPGDTVKTMQDTLNFAKDLGLNDAMFSITTPFPGTELWGAIDQSKIASLSRAFYFDCANNSKDINIFYNLSDARDSDIKEMMEKTQKILEEINRKSYCEKIFGNKIGFLAWQLSRIPALKNTGRVIISFNKKRENE